MDSVFIATIWTLFAGLVLLPLYAMLKIYTDSRTVRRKFTIKRRHSAPCLLGNKHNSEKTIEELKEEVDILKTILKAFDITVTTEPK